MDKEDFIKTLQNNVAFQLSLTSKELFHSNFLAWLAEDEATRGTFNELLQNCFGAKDLTFDPDEMMVMREYKNFDLCICEKQKNKNENLDEDTEPEFVPGDVLFVLENKVKSLPYKEQLKKYQTRVENENKNKHKAQYCLLSLAKGFKDFGEDWVVATYEEYAQALRKANKTNGDNSFKKDLINNYCEFIETFSGYIEECLKEVCSKDGDDKDVYDKDAINSEATWNILINHQEFRDIRCNDIWQKIVMQHCAKVLAAKVKATFGKEATMAHSDKDIWQEKGTENKGVIFTMVNFFHGEVLLELKYLIPGKGIFAFQQQGNHPLRIGILAMSKAYIVNTPKKKENKVGWQTNVENYFSKCGLLDYIKLKPKSQDKNEVNTYNSFGSFYYGYLTDEATNEPASIEQTLDEIVEVFKKLKPLIDSQESSSND